MPSGACKLRAYPQGTPWAEVDEQHDPYGRNDFVSERFRSNRCMGTMVVRDSRVFEVLADKINTVIQYICRMPDNNMVKDSIAQARLNARHVQHIEVKLDQIVHLPEDRYEDETLADIEFLCGRGEERCTSNVINLRGTGRLYKVVHDILRSAHVEAIFGESDGDPTRLLIFPRKTGIVATVQGCTGKYNGSRVNCRARALSHNQSRMRPCSCPTVISVDASERCRPCPVMASLFKRETWEHMTSMARHPPSNRADVNREVAHQAAVDVPQDIPVFGHARMASIDGNLYEIHTDKEGNKTASLLVMFEFLQVSRILRRYKKDGTETVEYEYELEIRNDDGTKDELRTYMGREDIENDPEFGLYKRYRTRIRISDDQIKNRQSVKTIFSNADSRLGKRVTSKFSENHLVDIRCELAKRNKVDELRTLRCFGKQLDRSTPAKSLYCFANLAIESEVSTHNGEPIVYQRIITLEQAGYFYDEEFNKALPGYTYKPEICPVEDERCRERFFRSFVHVLRCYTTLYSNNQEYDYDVAAMRRKVNNFENAMMIFASFVAMTKVDEVSGFIGGFPILTLCSTAGSTGKTELTRIFMSIFGLQADAMAGTVTEPAISDMLSRASCMPVVWDDYKEKHGTEMDQTMKMMYNMNTRVNMSRTNKPLGCVVLTCNNLLAQDDQPTQSRLALIVMKMLHKFNSKINRQVKEVKAIASMMLQDFIALPFNIEGVQECIDYVKQVMCMTARDGITTGRSAQNWGVILYFRLLLEFCMPLDSMILDPDTAHKNGWVHIFEHVVNEVVKNVDTYTGLPGEMDYFVKMVHEIRGSVNALGYDERSCINLHNFRIVDSAYEIARIQHVRGGALKADTRYYAFNISALSYVINNRARTATRRGLREVNKQSLELDLMKNVDVPGSGVHMGTVMFAQYDALKRMHSNGEYPTDSDVVSSVVPMRLQENAFIVEDRLMQPHTHQASSIDYRNVTTEDGKNILWWSVMRKAGDVYPRLMVNEDWVGFRGMRNHPYYYRKQWGKGPHSNPSAWGEPRHREGLFNQLSDMVKWYRPKGQIVFPRGPRWREREWNWDQYSQCGHPREMTITEEEEVYLLKQWTALSVNDEQDAQQHALDPDADMRRNEYAPDDFLFDDDDDMQGSQNSTSQHGKASQVLPASQFPPASQVPPARTPCDAAEEEESNAREIFERWIAAEHPLPTSSANMCRVCRVVYRDPPRCLLQTCASCFKRAKQKYKAVLRQLEEAEQMQADDDYARSRGSYVNATTDEELRATVNDADEDDEGEHLSHEDSDDAADDEERDSDNDGFFVDDHDSDEEAESSGEGSASGDAARDGGRTLKQRRILNDSDDEEA